MFNRIIMILISILSLCECSLYKEKSENFHLEKIELYLVPFNANYNRTILPEDIVKKADMKLTIYNDRREVLYNVKLELKKLQEIEKRSLDIRLMANIYFENGSKQKLYVSNTGYILTNGKVYQYNKELLKWLLLYVSKIYHPTRYDWLDFN